MTPTRTFDAIVVAGGRGSRLGGVDKPALRIAGVSLIARALAAVGEARRISVVRHVDDVPLDDRISRTVEDPPWSGPASAIAAGLIDLEPSTPPLSTPPLSMPAFVGVVAADLPRIEEAFAILSRHPIASDSDGLIAVDSDGRDQPLLAIYRRAALQAAVAAHPTGGLGVSRLIARLTLHRVPLGAGLCGDIDDEADAHAAGILLPRALSVDA